MLLLLLYFTCSSPTCNLCSFIVPYIVSPYFLHVMPCKSGSLTCYAAPAKLYLIRLFPLCCAVNLVRWSCLSCPAGLGNLSFSVVPSLS